MTFIKTSKKKNNSETYKNKKNRFKKHMSDKHSVRKIGDMPTLENAVIEKDFKNEIL